MVIVSDAGAGRYVPLLLGLTGVESARLERTLAAAIAGSLADGSFRTVGVAPTDDFDGSTYQTDNGGLAILPYSSSNLAASVLAALVAPDRFDRDGARGVLRRSPAARRRPARRRKFALAGLAGLHAAVLPQIRAAAADPGPRRSGSG